MLLLEEEIIKRGKIINGEILKVDSFLNHQVDPKLMEAIGEEFYHHFKKYPITKVVTIETSGIAPALMCALKLDVPMIFIKKAQPSTMQEAYVSHVFSFTKNKSYTICLSKHLIDKDDHILFIDDFLANGQAFLGVEQIIHEAGAVIEGVGIVIDKTFQDGHLLIKEKGYDLYSLAKIKSLDENGVIFDESI
ncbi:MAG: xanthine phosphoribosyltransferase [Beduini sp.]|uniref:xanthine phosphoribosyltransferase n=1 Tax=Beduini sp. TaxID=1922300 RepID=UPI0039A21232